MKTVENVRALSATAPILLCYCSSYTSFLATLIVEGPKICLDLGATPVLLFLQTGVSIGKLRVLHPQLCFTDFTSLLGREPC